MSRCTAALRGRPTRLLSRLLVAGALIIVGCSDDSSADGPGRDSSPNETVAFADQSVGLVTTPVEIQSDLTVIDRYVSASDFKELLARRDGAVVDCLADRGFTVSLQPVKSDTAAKVPDFGITRRQFAAKWGFGQVAPLTPDGGYSAEFNDIGKRQSAEPVRLPSGVIPDPDLDWTSVDESDSEGVTVALFGASQADPNATTAAGDTPSCLEAANQSVGLSADGGSIAAAGALRQQAQDRVANDPDILAAQQVYESCMSAKGFPDLSSPYDALLSVTKEFGALREAAFATVKDGDVPNVSTIGPDLETKFRVLQQREISTAVSNVDCEGSYLATAQPRSDALQEEVIDANPALVAQLGGGG